MDNEFEKKVLSFDDFVKAKRDGTLDSILGGGEEEIETAETLELDDDVAMEETGEESEEIIDVEPGEEEVDEISDEELGFDEEESEEPTELPEEEPEEPEELTTEPEEDSIEDLDAE